MSWIGSLRQKLAFESGWLRARQHALLFGGILALGIFARTWEFRTLPPGLNADEASIGVEAYDLSHFGMDRNGNPFPVQFVSWGSGQNALYGYLLVPFIAILGLSPAVVRLPMLISGICSLPLIYVAGREVLGGRLGLLSMFFLAISPWHILLSRWGLESNILPFLLLCAFTCMLLALKDDRWFLPACISLGLALYAYGTAYAAVPLFLACAVIILLRARAIRTRHLVGGVVAFVLVAAPIALFLIVNTLGIPSQSIGPISIPRLPVAPRFQTETVIAGEGIVASLMGNLWTMLRLLVTQSDGISYNTVDPFGYFYTLTLPLSVVGIILLLGHRLYAPRPASQLLLAWAVAGLAIGLLQAANVNRLNALFMPLLICTAVCILWLGTRHGAVLPAFVLAFLAAFTAFTAAYHGAAYRQQADFEFHLGLLPALRFSTQHNGLPICMTDQINMPYIFTLFAAPERPQEFLASVRYVDPSQPLRQVRSYGRYTFGTRSCSPDQSYVYLLTADEIPPRFGKRYDYQFFDKFVVYYPKP